MALINLTSTSGSGFLETDFDEIKAGLQSGTVDLNTALFTTTGITLNGNLTTTGTIDGRDIAADGTKLDFMTVTQAVDLDTMETDVGLNNTHRTSNGTDHTYINQDLQTTASPTFNQLDLNGFTGQDGLLIEANTTATNHPLVNFLITGTAEYRVGIDNTNDYFKIQPGGDITSATGLTMLNTGNTGLGVTPQTALQVNVATDKNWAVNLDTDAQLEAINDARSAFVPGRITANPLSINPGGQATTVGGTLGVTGALTAPTLNTGQGANELYAMNQDVETSDTVQFTSLGVGLTPSLGKFHIQQASAATGAYIHQQGASNGLVINQDASTANSALAGALVIDNKGNNYHGLSVYTDKDSTAAGSLALFTADTPTFDQKVVHIKNDGVGDGFYIDNNGGGIALNIDDGTANIRLKDAGSGYGAIYLSSSATPAMQTAAADGNLYIAAQSSNNVYIRDGGDTNLYAGNGGLIGINQATAAHHLDINATTNKGIVITQSSANNSIFIDQNGNAVALNIDNDATTNTSNSIYINTAVNAGKSIQVDHYSSAQHGMYLQDRVGYAGGQGFSTIYGHASSTKEMFHVRNDGSGAGILIDANSTGPGMTFQQSTDVEVMDFDACTDGGTGHTTVAGSLKVQMPNGTTGYINFYT